MLVNLCGKTYNSSDIDFVGIKRIKDENPIYKIVISVNKEEEIIESTTTIDELKICEAYKQIAKELSQDSCFFALNKFAPIVNVKRVKNIELKHSRILGYKNYLMVELHNGAVYKSKAMPVDDKSVNKNEYYYYLFCSSRIDELYK